MYGSKILWRVPSLHNHSLDPRAAIVLDLVPRASGHQADEARFLNFWKISFQARVTSIWTWIEEIRPEGSNLKENVWRLPSLHGHRSGRRGPIDLDSFSRASAKGHTKHLVLGFYIFEKLNSGPELWPFENGLTKSVRKAPILRQIWPEFFFYGKTTSRAWWWPQKLSQKSISSQSYNISVQSIPTKWYFWAFFFETVSLFWFSLFLLSLSGFWLFSFKPPLALLGGVITS